MPKLPALPASPELLRRFWRARGLWLRILFCWALGSSLPLFDETKDYDMRFRLRGSQETVKQIVIVYLDQDDWSAWSGPNANTNLLRSLKEFAPITDSSFWRARTWDLLLGKVLAQNPESVGVMFFFSDQLPKPDDSLHALFDPRVVWAGQLDNEGRPALPLMANSYGYNVALVDLREDEDRILRRFSPPQAPLPHMSLKLAQKRLGNSADELNDFMGEARLINFRGPPQIFPSVSALAILQNRIPPGFFKDKIVSKQILSRPHKLHPGQ